MQRSRITTSMDDLFRKFARPFALLAALAAASTGKVYSQEKDPILQSDTPPTRDLPPCQEQLGRIRDYQPIDSSISPFGVVYNSSPLSPQNPTGHKYIFTDSNSSNLFVMNENGGPITPWPSSALLGYGCGITIAGRDVLGEDYIWASDTSNTINKLFFTGGKDDEIVGAATAMGGIVWDDYSDSLLVLDMGDGLEIHPSIRQYDVQSHQLLREPPLEIPLGITDPVGITMFSRCNNNDDIHLIISRVLEPDTFMDLTANYTGRVLTGYSNPQIRSWDDEGFPRNVDCPMGVSYNPVTEQLLLVNSYLCTGNNTLFTSIDDGCCPTGDTNCDGLVNAFDIDPFILALVNQPQYRQNFPNCAVERADCNGDGAVNAFDIDPFIEILVSK